MIVTRRLRVETRGNDDVVDLTDRVQREVAASGLGAGTATLFVLHSTAALTTIEVEPGLIEDLKEALSRLVPRDLPYRHNLAPGEDNGHAHLRASLLGPSLVVPIVDGRLLLGTWQQIVLVDPDTRPRSREVVVQLMGE